MVKIMSSAYLQEDNWNCSYIFGIDNESGWGKRYFFTYFNEFGNNELSVRIIFEVAGLVCLFIGSLLSNFTIVFCILRYPEMKTVTNCFVLNLAVADLLFALSIPPVVFARITASWLLGDLPCKLIPYTQFVSGVVLLWTLTLISTDRYRCIVVPPYRSNITTVQVSFYSLSIWVFSAVATTPIFLWFKQFQTSDGLYLCTIIFPKSDHFNYALCFVVPLITIACLLPMTILVYNYHRIFQKILSTRNTWASSCVATQNQRRQSEVSISEIFTPWPRRMSTTPPQNPRHNSLSQHEELRLNKHIKAVRVLFLNVLVVLLMWLPITITILLIFLDGRRPTEDTSFFLRSRHFIWALIVAYLNTVINPLLYGMLSDSFRSCLSSLVRCGGIPEGPVNDAVSSRNCSGTQGLSYNNNNQRGGNCRKPSFISSVSENQEIMHLA